MRVFKIAIAVLAIGLLINVNTLESKANNSDFEELLQLIEEDTGLEQKYIQVAYMLNLNNKSYLDKFPNIYRDTVIESKGTILNVDNMKYQQFLLVKTTGLDRPSEYFLPDSLYSLSYDIKTLMQYNYYRDRGGYQKHFNSYNEEVKNFICFCESIIDYNDGDSTQFIRAYEMYKLDYVDTIQESLKINGIQQDKIIKDIETIFSIFEVSKGSLEVDKNTYEMPYIVGYTSKENMLEAAISLVGRVRYTWAGGHAHTSNIRGINPIWKEWNTLYETSEIGKDTCIKTSPSWCPIHGFKEDERCIYEDITTDYNQYIDDRATLLGSDELKRDKYKNMLDYIDPEDGAAHRLDGLDCSGYASWVVNQITNEYVIDSSAMYFTRQAGIESIEFGSELKPGDIFAWTSHIVIIVGKVSDNSKVYVTVEQTPNTLKFGTIYYSGYNNSDLEYGMQIAREANQLIGDLDEEPHSYCMNSVGHYSIDLEDESQIDGLSGNVQSIEQKEIPLEQNDDINETELTENEDEYTIDNDEYMTDNDESEQVPQEVQTITTVNMQYVDIGRFQGEFVDSNEKLINGKTIDESIALDIIQYIIERMPLEYIEGYKAYKGSLFSLDIVSTNVGTTLLKEVSNNED